MTSPHELFGMSAVGVRPDASIPSTSSAKSKTLDIKRPPNPEDRRALFQRINKQISHLTTERTSVADEKIGPADREEMYGWVHAFLVILTTTFAPTFARLGKSSSVSSAARVSMTVKQCYP